MSYARARQRTRQFSERLISRDHVNFSYGMARRADVESTNIPPNAAADGVNVRFHKVGWEGRTGSYLHTMDIGVTVTDAKDATLSAFMQSGGELYAANGGAVPDIGDTFIVYGVGDTADDALETAKGYPVRRYDCFRVDNNATGSESITYLGRLGAPAAPGYGDTPATEFTASQSGNIITATVGAFDTSCINSYFNFGDGSCALIEEYLSPTTVRVSNSQTRASTPRCFIQLPINANIYHEGVNKTVAQFGRRIYVCNGISLCEWTEAIGIGRQPYFGPANVHGGRFIIEGDDVILININGMYRVRLVSEPYYYKLNSIPPNVVIIDEEESKNADYKYKYNYTYSLSRLSGGTTLKDRLDVADGIVLEHESPPVKTNNGVRDWGYRWAVRPVGAGDKTYGLLTGGALEGAYATQAGWSNISDGEFVMSVSGENYTIGVDLSGITDMNDLCKRLTYAAQTHKPLKKVTFEYDEDHIIVKTGEGQTIGVCTSAGGTGTDISDALGLTADKGATATTPSYTAPLTVYYLSMPQDSDGNTINDWWHATHYTVYRTGNAADLPDDVDAHDYRWVKDVPVAKAFTGSVDGNTLTVTKGTIEYEDRNAVVFAEDGSYFTISTEYDGKSSTVAPVTGIKDKNGNPITSIPLQSMAIGGCKHVFTASQSGTAIMINSGVSLDSSYVGKQIFWADNTISIIKSVIDASNAIALSSETHETQGACCDPVSRVISDTISDDDIRQDYARFAGWPLRIRYQDAMPDADIGIALPGYILTAVQGTSEYAYCSRLYRWHVGYYHPGFQVYKDIVDGIQALYNKDASLLIVGSRKKYYVDSAAGYEVGETRIGESVTKLPDPSVISNAIGTVPSNAAQELENGTRILVTNEPAVRIMAISEDSANLADGRIQKSDLCKMSPVYIGAYDPVCGYFLWGKQEVGNGND